MRAIKEEVRCLAIRHYIEYKNPTLTCSIFCIGRTTLWRFIRMSTSGASLRPKYKTQPKKFSAEHRQYIVKHFSQRRYTTIQRAIKSFHRKYNIWISSRTIRRILKQNRISYRALCVKKKVPRPKKVFHKNIRGIPLHRILSVDEMGFSHGHIHPKKTWCSKSSKNQVFAHRGRFHGYNKTVTCITDCRRVIHYEWSGMPMNTCTFSKFLQLSLFGYAGYHLILDNDSFHKSKVVTRVLQDNGVTPHYIDPYTPQQNPIEEVFSNVKAYVKRKCPMNEIQFERYLSRAMRHQTAKQLVKYFQRAVSYKD
jgi:transposase